MVAYLSTGEGEVFPPPLPSGNCQDLPKRDTERGREESVGFLLQTLLPLLFEAFFSRAANKKEKTAAAAGMKSGSGPLFLFRSQPCTIISHPNSREEERRRRPFFLALSIKVRREGGENGFGRRMGEGGEAQEEEEEGKGKGEKSHLIHLPFTPSSLPFQPSNSPLLLFSFSPYHTFAV